MAVESSELKKLGAHLYSCTQRATKASITYTQKSAHKKRIIFMLYKACFMFLFIKKTYVTFLHEVKN